MLTFLLVLLWLGLLFLFARWFSRFLQTTRLPPDIRVLALVGVVALLLFVGIFLILKRAKQPKPPTPDPASVQVVQPQAVDSLDAYEQATYPALYGLRQDMLKQINDLRLFFRQVREWGNAMPNQRTFLQKVVDVRWQRAQELNLAYQTIDRSRRAFWLHRQTGDDRYVLEMFDAEAQRLQKRIQTALGDSNRLLLDEMDIISRHVRDAVTWLKTEKLLKTKTGQYPFQPYSEANRQRLQQWLMQRQEGKVVADLQSFVHGETLIRERITYILQYHKVNTDLQFEVGELFQKWNNALIYNQYTQFRLLFAVEVLDLLERLGMEHRTSRDYSLLLEQLRIHAPKLVEQAELERRIAAFSYNPDLDRKYRKQAR